MSDYRSLDELVWLFEAKTRNDFDDIGWPVSGITFETTRGERSIQCSIGIYDYSFGVVASHRGDRIFDLHLHQVVRHHDRQTRWDRGTRRVATTWSRLEGAMVGSFVDR